MGVLRVEAPDLQLADERVRRRDRVVVDEQAVAHVEVVVHAHDVHEQVDVVDEGRRAVVPLPGADAVGAAGALQHLGLDVLELAGARRLRHHPVLGVAEPREDLVQLPVLDRQAHEVDVRVLAVHEAEVGAVAAHREAAHEAHLDAVAARLVDERHGLGHVALGRLLGRLLHVGRRLERRAPGLSLGRQAQVLERGLDGVEDGPRDVGARPAARGQLLEHPPLLQLADRLARRRVAHAERLLRLGDGDERRAEQVVDQLPRVPGDLPAVLLAERHERAHLGGGALGRLAHGVEEEGAATAPRRRRCAPPAAGRSTRRGGPRCRPRGRAAGGRGGRAR